jgi:NAD(P)-dependent dehydrogenase (short-subunit alcohol dehydrogenase family)
MDLQLKHREALVTGSTAGIGFAIASLLAEEGAAVVVSGRSQERVDSAVKKIRQAVKNAEVSGVAADLGTKQGVELLTNKVGAVDILVNNLGIYEATPFPEITDEDWLRFFRGQCPERCAVEPFLLASDAQKELGPDCLRL